MSAVIIDGRAVAAAVRAEVAEHARALTDAGTRPGLGVVLCGDDPAVAWLGRNLRARVHYYGLDDAELHKLGWG